MTSAICKPFALIAIGEKKTVLTLVSSVDSAVKIEHSKVRKQLWEKGKGEKVFAP
jgi:ethanolamine utilization protein EutP (predicted NTPase)